MKAKSPTSTICTLLSIGKAFPENCKRDGCGWWHAYNKSEKARLLRPGVYRGTSSGYERTRY